jgi:putative FmdB family regulatory protein
MPIYVFECQKCEHEAEEIISFSDSEKYLETECPKCFTKAYKKRVNSTSFKLKGKGWYKDGYRGKT